MLNRPTMATAKEDTTMDTEVPQEQQSATGGGQEEHVEVNPNPARESCSSENDNMQKEDVDKNIKEGVDKNIKPSMAKGASMQMKKSDDKRRTNGSSTDWPDTLEGFGYKFDDEGILKDIKTGGPFNFMYSEDHVINQRRYEALGEVITEEVYNLLETRGGLKRKYVPIDAKEDDAQSFIFVSKDWKTSDKLMVLIHGSGVVRAGQWTRKLIINNSLTHGSMLPFIEYAKAIGYGVVVLNTNYNYYKDKSGKKKKIPKNGSPEDHANYVWKHLIKEAKAKKIAIIAHSYGGVCTVSLARQFKDDFLDRVFAIAFTDSVHIMSLHNVKKDIAKHFEEIAINWCASEKPLDTPLHSYRYDARRVSAGHTQHEWTTWSSFDSILKFLEEMDQKGYTTIGVDDAQEVRADDDIPIDMETDTGMKDDTNVENTEETGEQSIQVIEDSQPAQPDRDEITRDTREDSEENPEQTDTQAVQSAENTAPTKPDGQENTCGLSKETTNEKLVTKPVESKSADLASKEIETNVPSSDGDAKIEDEETESQQDVEENENVEDKGEKSFVSSVPGDSSDTKEEQNTSNESAPKSQEDVLSGSQPDREPGDGEESKIQENEKDEDSKMEETVEHEEDMQIGSPTMPEQTTEGTPQQTHTAKDQEKEEL